MSAPSGRSVAATASAPSPLASIGTRKPLPGTGAIMATSVTGMPCALPSSASSRLTPGDAVLRSAQTTPGESPSARIASSDPRSAATASFALFTLSTRCAPAHASASLPALVKPSAPVTPATSLTAGSKPRTTAPAVIRSRAMSEPASPRPRTAMTGVGAGVAPFTRRSAR